MLTISNDEHGKDRVNEAKGKLLEESVCFLDAVVDVSQLASGLPWPTTLTNDL